MLFRVELGREHEEAVKGVVVVRGKDPIRDRSCSAGGEFVGLLSDDFQAGGDGARGGFLAGWREMHEVGFWDVGGCDGGAWGLDFGGLVVGEMGVVGGGGGGGWR